MLILQMTHKSEIGVTFRSSINGDCCINAAVIRLCRELVGNVMGKVFRPTSWDSLSSRSAPTPNLSNLE